MLLIFGVFTGIFVYGQGSTTAGLNGRVVNGDTGETLPGATVLAVHQGTGFQYGGITDADGYFRLPNLNVGGPYKITVSFVGYHNYEQDNVYLSLGQTLKLNVKLTEDSKELSEVVIVGSRNDLFDGNRTGAQTVVDEDVVRNMPTVARDLSDFTRLTPMASITSGGGINIAGMNSRYNSIYIDGAINNDVFGLADNGSNGGQIGISPISIDAIEQFQVVIAPFDVRQGGFAGGGINAVTRSGTNKFKGSVYYFMRNENLAGKTPTDDESVDKVKLDPFSTATYGFRLGGPIIENKLFFFANAELQKEETPQPYDFNTYIGDASRADIESLISKVNGLGYDPGGYENTTKTLDGTKFLIKFDYNINKSNKLMLRHSYTKGVSTSPSRSSSSRINFANGGVYFPSTTNSTALELKSYLSESFSNKFILGYTTVRDQRDPIGDNFPKVKIRDGNGDIYFGSEEYSTANQLDQNIFTLTDNFQLYKGRHTFTFGTHNEFYSIYNLFIRQNFGVYEYDSLSQFMTDVNASDFYRSYSVIDNITGDGSAAAADFNAIQLGFYAQDEIDVNDKLKVTAGLRIDIPIFPQNPEEDTHFNSATIDSITQWGYDMQGAKAGQMPKPQFMFSPRVGFNYDLMGDQSAQLRGGIGIFTSRIPFVWPGAAYNNNGLMVGNTFQSDVAFNPDWNNQPTSTTFDPTATDVPSGDINLFAENFKFPQVMKIDLAFDKKLPMGLIGSVEVMYTKTLNNVYYQNFNIKPSVKNLTGTGDTRPIFNRYDEVDDTYGYIMLATNTNKGYTTNFTVQLQRPADQGLSVSIAYTYGNAFAVNDGTSSQNSSQWRYMEQSSGRNYVGLTRSDFDLGHRIVGYLSYSKEYIGHLATTVSLFYNGQSGKTFSYTYNNYRLTNENSKDMDLIYVPADQNDIHLIDIGSPGDDDYVSAADQWKDLNEYIEQDAYLSTRRGKYSERNGARLPFVNIFDFRFSQDLYTDFANRRNTLQFTFDLFNLGNLINDTWGRRYYANYYGNIRLIKFKQFQADGTTPEFTFTRPKNDAPWDIDDSGINSSRWQAQIGIRYIF
ncbi:MAG: TonB-dependent receptor [Chlorobi bacterium]|nr:TonB-dependent receptor [Chlorobiota bacterium]